MTAFIIIDIDIGMNMKAEIKMLRPADYVHGLLMRKIMLNELQPESVLTELGLAEELGCSQGTIREALLRLQQDGLVSRSGRRGTLVTRLRAEEAQEMLVLRRHIEMKGALKAVDHLSEKDKQHIVGLRAAMDEAVRQNDEYGLIEVDMDFHMSIFRLAGLDALESILSRCIIHGHRSKLWAPGHRRTLVETAQRHDILLAALLEGNGTKLADNIGQHIDTMLLIEGV
ncbi:MAG: GntR family transcriptional regulator [Methylocystaceae bacterium]|nr:GntR family transcriptional regulator [Methylocystaceae bacterium]